MTSTGKQGKVQTGNTEAYRRSDAEVPLKVDADQTSENSWRNGTAAEEHNDRCYEDVGES